MLKPDPQSNQGLEGVDRMTRRPNQAPPVVATISAVETL